MKGRPDINSPQEGSLKFYFGTWNVSHHALGLAKLSHLITGSLFYSYLKISASTI